RHGLSGSDQAAMQDYVRRRLAGTEPAPVAAINPVAGYFAQQRQFADDSAGQIQTMDPAPGIAPQDRSFDAPVYVENPGLPPGDKQLPMSNWQQRLGELRQQLDTAHQAYQAAPVWTLLFHPELRQQWLAAYQALNAHLNTGSLSRATAASD